MFPTLRGLVAQSVEQCPFKALVESSSLSQPTNFRLNSVKAKEYCAEVKRRQAKIPFLFLKLFPFRVLLVFRG